MSSPLAAVTSGLATATHRQSTEVTRAAAEWNDAAFRKLDQQVLRPLRDESNRFAAALQHLDVALGRALNDLSR